MMQNNQLVNMEILYELAFHSLVKFRLTCQFVRVMNINFVPFRKIEVMDFYLIMYQSLFGSLAIA